MILSPLKNIVTGDGQTLISQSISVLCRFLMQIHKICIFSNTYNHTYLYLSMYIDMWKDP